ncbi:MAG: hypothetical protein NWE96_07475 [Candidatus Bathyarchaeota archaeon]|nr:hypothetical protein [Candidatus Bathyarchaeota archaeon]
MNNKRILRFNLDNVEKALLDVERNWTKINDQLEYEKLGKRDSFDSVIRGRMMDAYRHLDNLLGKGVEPFSTKGLSEIPELNNIVHYGFDIELRLEFNTAIQANLEKYAQNIVPIEKWYKKHMKGEPHPLKAASQVYVAALGFPQLFIEGNHRTANLIANWISMYYGHPPFVLSPEKAIAYFRPSKEIKRFVDKSTWRGRARLPKYRRCFKKFWEQNIDSKYTK